MRELTIKLVSWAQAHKAEEKGQGVIEYGLIVGLVSVALAVVLATQGAAWIGRVTTGVAAALSTAGL